MTSLSPLSDGISGTRMQPLSGKSGSWCRDDRHRLPPALATSWSFPRLKKKQVIPGAVPPLPPGPKPWPIIGCVPEMWRNRPAHIWMHDILDQLNTDIACVRLGKIHVIIVKSPELAREFLKNHDKTFASRPIDMASQSLSSGYLSTAVVPLGKQWKKMRRVLIVDMLNQSRMRWLLDKRNDEADNLVRFLYNQCSNNANGSVVSVRNAAQNYSASVIRKMIFNMRYFGKGRKDGGPGLEEDRHLSALLTILSYLYAFYVPDYLPWLGLFDIEGHEKKVRDAVKIIKQYQKPIIDERIRKWRSSNQEQTICEKPVQEDLLDVFILLKDANGQPLLSAEEIEAQVTVNILIP